MPVCSGLASLHQASGKQRQQQQQQQQQRPQLQLGSGLGFGQLDDGDDHDDDNNNSNALANRDAHTNRTDLLVASRWAIVLRAAIVAHNTSSNANLEYE